VNTPALKLWCYPEPMEMAFRGMDKVHSAIRYLDLALKSDPRWPDTMPREVVQANLDARCLLLRLEARLWNEARELARSEGWPNV